MDYMIRLGSFRIAISRCFETLFWWPFWFYFVYLKRTMKQIFNSDYLISRHFTKWKLKLHSILFALQCNVNSNRADYGSKCLAPTVEMCKKWPIHQHSFNCSQKYVKIICPDQTEHRWYTTICRDGCYCWSNTICPVRAEITLETCKKWPVHQRFIELLTQMY